MLLAMIAAVLMIVSAHYRGPWLDDFATFRFADPTVPWAVAWRDLWPTETNPPLFYAIAREGVAHLGASLGARRMVNLAPLGFVLIWFSISMRRHPSQRLFLALYWLIAASSFFFVWDFSSYRSYFYQYCVALVFVGAIALDELEHRPGVNWFALAAVALLINLHQVTALYASAMLLVLIGLDVRRGFWRRAFVFAMTAVISAIPLIAFTMIQQSEPASVRALVTWIHPHGVLTSVGLILGFLPRALGENWIALCAGAGAIIWVRPQGASAELLRLLAASAMLGTAMLLVANHFVPLIVDRYFAFLTVICACAIAVAVLPWCARFPLLPWIFFAFAAIYLTAGFIGLLRDQRWNSGGDLVAKLAAECPTTRIHAGVLPRNPAEQTGLGYLAAARHLRLLPVEPDQPGACPMLYWTEYLPPSRLDLARFHGDAVRAANARANWGLSEEELKHTTAVRSQNGIVLIVKAH